MHSESRKMAFGLPTMQPSHLVMYVYLNFENMTHPCYTSNFESCFQYLYIQALLFKEKMRNMRVTAKTLSIMMSASNTVTKERKSRSSKTVLKNKSVYCKK